MQTDETAIKSVINFVSHFFAVLIVRLNFDFWMYVWCNCKWKASRSSGQETCNFFIHSFNTAVLVF